MSGRSHEKISSRRYHGGSAGSSFCFEDHKSALNRMFFTANQKIIPGTKEYNDFWTFLSKYLQSLKSGKSHGNNSAIIEQMKASVHTDWMDIDYLMTCKGAIFKDDDYYGASALTKERITRFRDILLLYLNFLEKKRLKAVEKLKQDKENLPIFKHKQNILDALNTNSVILIAGDTGCGKSTQVPQYLLEAGYTGIVCTQPRRIACISLCKRVSYETADAFGSLIGYQIRFERHKTQDTRILFITEGLMLRQVTSDPLLSDYNVILLDEVHERHLTLDFLLGLMKCLLIQRPNNLKVILMSATINIDLFSRYFGDCPVIQVPGRLHPIQLYYHPVKDESYRRGNKINPEPYLRLLKMIDETYPSDERGDVLVFLSGLTEIETVADHCKPYAIESRRWIVLPLHSSLSLEEQDRIFDLAPEGVRKVILSTNIAETSVTIDGIRFVIDSGKMKEMSFDPSIRMARLQEFWISKASAEQRKGRAGRTGPGVCYRLYSSTAFNEMEAYSKPEIHRVPLDYLLLRVIELGLADVTKFPFIEAPSEEIIKKALISLKENGAVNELNDDKAGVSITPMGRMLTKLPVDIIIGKMLILGSMFDLIEPIISMGACLSVQSPLTAKGYSHLSCIEARKGLEVKDGDPFLLLRAYNEWLNVKSKGSEDSRKWCKRRGFEEQRFYEITKLRRQFRDVIKGSGLYFKDNGTHRGRGCDPGTSAERIKRHGQRRQLSAMKRQLESNEPKRRKILKIHFGWETEDNPEDEFNEAEPDLRAIEFRLLYSERQLKELKNSSEAFKGKDLNLMKIILSSGLYPQLSVPDPFNSFKKDSDQFFHTKGKPFVVLHPNSVYALDPDLLRLNDHSATTKGSGISSCNHSLLAYLLLLETTKPYLVNCLKVPAAHTLLLFAHSIDTNVDCTRLVFDKWIEIRLSANSFPKNFVSTAIQVRDLWLHLLTKVFQESLEREDCNEDNHGGDETGGGEDEDTKTFSPEVVEMKGQLNEIIDHFLSIRTEFTIKRLLPADITCLYKGPDPKLPPDPGLGGEALITSPAEEVNSPKRIRDGDNVNPFANVFTATDNHLKCYPDPVKGGIKINSYLTYNCLSDYDISKEKLIKKSWRCSNCGKEMVTTLLDEIRHREKCFLFSEAYGKIDLPKEQLNPADCSSSSSKPSVNEEISELPQENSMARNYQCETCQKTLYLIPTEIVKHLRSHSS